MCVRLRLATASFGQREQRTVAKTQIPWHPVNINPDCNFVGCFAWSVYRSSGAIKDPGLTMNENPQSGNSASFPKSKLRVEYEVTQVLHISQCLLNTTADEVVFDFSSGVLPDPDTGQPVLPVQARLAMSRTNARRLHDLLGKTLDVASGSIAGAQVGNEGPVPTTTPKVTAKAVTGTQPVEPRAEAD